MRDRSFAARSAWPDRALQKPDIAFADLELPDGSGMRPLEKAGPLDGAEVVLVAAS